MTFLTWTPLSVSAPTTARVVQFFAEHLCVRRLDVSLATLIAWV